MPTQERLRELFDYDPIQGDLLYKTNRRKDRIGKPTSTTSGGYKKVAFKHDGKVRIFAVHRVVWVMHHGQIPPGMQIDHIDRDRVNNRLENLRVVTPKENLANRPNPAHSRSEIRGVQWNKYSSAWRAHIKWKYKSYVLGQFKDIRRAIAVRRLAEDVLLLEHGTIEEAMNLIRGGNYALPGLHSHQGVCGHRRCCGGTQSATEAIRPAASGTMSNM